MENPAEVQELRNKLRMMKFPQDEILNAVRKQQRAIHKQKQSNETLRNEITEYEAQIAAIDQSLSAHDTSEDLNRLKTQEKNLSNKLGVLSADFSAQDQKRRVLEDEVSKARSKAGGIFAQSHENEEIQARIRTMENRLDKALVRYNQNLTKLSEKRAQIDELRKDRFTFREVIRNAENERKKLDKEMADLITESNEAYSERDRMKMELVALKTTEKEDLMNYEKEMERLNQTIEGQRMASNRPHDQQQSVPSISSQVGNSNDAPDELNKYTEEYQGKINKTLELLQMKTVDQLFSEAEKLERENFSLFNFVVEHGATRTKLQEEILSLENQRDAILSKSHANEIEQSAELTQLTEEISEYQKQLEEIEVEKVKSETEFSAIYSEIEELFNLLGCSWTESPDEKSTVTPTNALFALTQIETTITQIMTDVGTKAMNQYQAVPPENKPANPEEKPEVSSGPKQPPVKPADLTAQPKLFEANKPLSLDEIRAKLMEGTI